MSLIEIIKNPLPWYIAGPLIGLTVPTLLIIGNKTFGISTSLRHICASCMPMDIPFFNYDWKKEIWNLYFVLGVLIGGFVAYHFLSNPSEIVVSTATRMNLSQYHIQDYSGLIPAEIFHWRALLTVRGFIMMVIGGFMVGFGTRYAGGCTSGHAIMGLSYLQLPSLIATICFMIGGFVMTWLILPFILSL